MNTVKIIQTAKHTNDRLTEKNPLQLMSEKKVCITFALNPNKTFQKIIGFGGAFTESASYTLSKLSPEKRDEIIKKYFDPVEGLAYSIGRVHINSCDFSLGNYTYVEDNDTELKTFNISHEEKWVIPFINQAKKVRNGDIGILASPWSPPAWMKTNGEMNNGGKLIPEYANTWAMYYAKFIKAMKEKGINICALTVQNEPAACMVWDSCIYSAEEERDFVKNHLGPTLESEGLSEIRLYVWDHNRDLLVERASCVLDDPEASKYIYGTANHWYVSEDFSALSTIHNKYPNKHLLFSEGCQEGGVHLDSWSTGERYGRNMIGDFNNWQEGWLDWNLLLDETGGPNHVGNLCDAPIIADTKTDDIHYNSSFYYIGHFSKFVKPGAIRIEVTQNEATELKHVAFFNEDNSIALIVQNETDNEHAFNIELKGQYVTYTMPEHSIVTIILNQI